MNVTRRQLLTGAAASAVLAAGGIGYYIWARPETDLLPPAANAAPPPPDAQTAQLLQPGPLEEMALGDEKAPVTIIEYASMTCPHCASFHTTTYPELKKRYIDTGKVRFIFREFPLDPLAAAGFLLARCAPKDKYFPLIETLFQQQEQWVTQKPLEPLRNISRQAGFTDKSFEECLANQNLLDGIEAVRQRAAEKLGVKSTPTFFINGKVFRGALTVPELEKAVEPYLKSS